MEALSNKGETEVPKGFAGFFKYVFNFDENNKALIFNFIQYALLAVIPVVLSLKGIGYVIPDEDDTKGSLEILGEVVGQLVLMLIAIWFINKMVRYVPTYSGVDYQNFNETNFIIAFLILLLTMKTKLGEKITILWERLMALWNGEDISKKDNKNKGQQVQQGSNVRVLQPLAGGNNQMGMSSMNGMNSNPYNPSGLMAPGLPPAQSSVPQVAPYKNPNFDDMYAKDFIPITGAQPGEMEFEPMAANAFGSPFGSSF
jgi:hypothetical protein